jgi:hypothetical protein
MPYLRIMALTPITAPTPSQPDNWYAVQKVRVVSPDGQYDAWGIISEITGELLNHEHQDKPWLAKTWDCALDHVRYLNGRTSEFPVCTCETD